MKKRFFNLSMLVLVVLTSTSCVEEKVIDTKKTRSYLYIILDKSSSSYSTNGGIEENYINVDTIYLNSFIDDLFYNQKRNEKKNEIILFFNYVDVSVKGNKEVYLKLPVIPVIDTVYVAKPGEVQSSERVFKQEVQKLKNKNEQLIRNFLNDKAIKLMELSRLLDKSKAAKGSDCSGLLKYADNKINNVIIDTTSFLKGRTAVIAFSDLVNYPSSNTTKIKMENVVLRPGYTGRVPYLEDTNIINLTSNEEFKDYLFTFLKIN